MGTKKWYKVGHLPTGEAVYQSVEWGVERDPEDLLTEITEEEKQQIIPCIEGGPAGKRVKDAD